MAKTQGEALAEIAELSKTLGEAAEDRAKTDKTLKSILDTIGTLDKDDAKALFKNEQVQRLIELASEEIAESSDSLPGTIGSGPFGQKKPWNESDLNKLIEQGKMALVRGYTPWTSIPVFWNGLRRNFVAQEEIDVPQCFVDVYKQHLAAEKQAEQHAAWLFRKRNTLGDASMANENGFRARGMAGEGQGHYVPGGGLVDMSEREAAE